MLDPNSNSITQQIPSAWVRLNSLSIVRPSGVSSGALAINQVPYILDSGTSYLLLTPTAFASFNAAFCPAVLALNSSWLCAGVYSNAAYYGYQLTLGRNYTSAQLNAALPNISFVFQSGSGSTTVNLLPSQYLRLTGYTTASPAR